jgi:subtilisin family serine protease
MANGFGGINYSKYIVQYSGGFQEKIKNIPRDILEARIITPEYAVVAIRIDQVNNIKKELAQVAYFSRKVIFALEETSPKDAANVSMIQGGSYLNLQGEGVLVAIVDTGIDYLNEEFMYDDYKSRIVSIWDQGINTNDSRVPYGTEYTRENINEAISGFRSGKDPYSIVQSSDSIGHGTNIAGIVGAKGRDPELQGVAPKCEFIIVRLQEDEELKQYFKLDKNIPVYSAPDVITGINYAYNKAEELKKPCIILVSVGTTFGSHDGTNFTEKFIDQISRYRGIAVVTGTGNEGAAETHVKGNILKEGDINNIELNIDKTYEVLEIFIVVEFPNKMSISVTSPSGETYGKVSLKESGVGSNKYILEETTIFVTYNLQQETSGDETIIVRMENLKPGLWRIRLYGEYITNGLFNAWLPQKMFLSRGTRFVKASPLNTLTAPGTATDIITVAYYNQQIDTVVLDSGRGDLSVKIKPDIAAGGINAVTTGLGSSKEVVNGSSVGAAVVAGASALIFEWGIVKGNDPTMYAAKLKAYLIRGASRRAGDIYPNTEWGFGKLNLINTFENIRSAINNEVKDIYKNNLIVRIPKDLSRALIKGCDKEYE